MQPADNQTSLDLKALHSHPCVAQLLAEMLLMHEFRVGLAARFAL